MELIDIRKIIREIVYELLQDDIVPNQKIQEVQENKGPIPMDIDVAQLENAKELLAVNGKVNGASIQCLVDSCANISFIQKEATTALKLEVDESVKHNISGASGSNETLGMVRDVSIELAPGCIINEDLVVLNGYKYNEIGLSRACLKRHNYDIHESRKHIALTCNDKNYFIPIISDMNRT